MTTSASTRPGRSRARSPGARLGALVAPALAACAGPPTPGDAGDAEASPARVAYLTVDQTVRPNDPARSASVVVRFLQVRGAAVDEAALRWVGVPDRPAAGTCTRAAAELAESPVRAVELLDVGPATLELPGGTRPLAARHLPDPVGLSGGLVYAGRVEELPPSLRVDAEGLAALTGGGLEIPLRPHDAPSGLVVTREGESLVVRWDASAERAASGSSVALELERDGRVIATCGAEDVGDARVPAALPDEGAVTAVVVHRLLEDHDRARGFDDVVVRHDLARAVEVPR